MVVSRENIDQFSEIVRLVARLGFDGVSFLDVIPVDDVAAAMCPPAMALAEAHRKDALRLARSLGLRPSASIGTPACRLRRCPTACSRGSIFSSGWAATCAMFALFDSDTAIVMGNLLRQEFHEVWYGEPFRTFRKTSMLGTNPLCGVCPYR